MGDTSRHTDAIDPAVHTGQSVSVSQFLSSSPNKGRS